MKRNLHSCSLVKVIPRGNRISFIFKHPEIKNSPMRTMEIKLGTKKKSLYETYSMLILGYIPSFEELSNTDISDIFLEKSAELSFDLTVQPSRCRRFTDILEIQRSS
jgi:hypothetical protein